MNCRDAAGYLRDRAATAPDADDRAEFEAHLAACANCREFVREYDLAPAVVRAVYLAADPARAGALSPETLQRILSGIDDDGRER